jgi:tetratricopeptide (TPR) repeat protein
MIKAACEPFTDSGRLEYFWGGAKTGSLKATYSPDWRQASEGIKTVRVKVRDAQGRGGEAAAYVLVTKAEDLEAAIDLSDPRPPVNQKISAGLAIRKGKIPPGAAIRWRSTGGLALDQDSGPNISLTARGDGRLVASVVKNGKTLKEFTAAVAVRPQEADKPEPPVTMDAPTAGVPAKGAPAGEKPGRFSGKITAPGEVGYSEIFKAVAEVPADFAQRKIEYHWRIYPGELLNAEGLVSSTRGPEAVIQPEYDRIIKNNLSELEITVSVDDVGSGRRNLGEGKIRIKLRPESFSARAPKPWSGKADRHGIDLSCGKKEMGPRGLIIAMVYGEVTVKLALSYFPGKGNNIRLGDFEGYLLERPPSPGSGGVGSLEGMFSKGKVVFAVQGRVSSTVGAVADQSQVKEAQQRLQNLYQEMLAIVKSVRLGPGGGMTWDPARDPQTAGEPAGEKPLETPKPLTVRMHAAKKQLLPGESLAVEAVVENAKPEDQPLVYTWTGEHEGQGAKVGFSAAKPGKYNLKVDVKSAKGATASASLDLEVVEPKVEIVKVSPPGSSLPVGGKAVFQVKFAGVPGKSYIYQWQPHPGALWDQPEGPATQAAATFRRPEKVQVWVKVLEKKGAALTPVAESPQLTLEVVQPQFKLTFTPTAPLIGQEVKARVEVTPSPPDLSLRWQPLPANAQMLGESQDGREITFTLKDDKPAALQALALVKGTGDSLGEASGTIQARKFKVTATVVGPMGPEPMKWDPVKGGMTSDPKAIAIHQNVRVKAAITPEPPKGPVRWQWSVNADSHIQSGQGGTEIMVNRSQVGACEITVEAMDAQGSKLGSAATTFQVTVDQGVVSKELREAALKKAAEGKLDEAIALMEQAVKLDPVSTANANLLKKLKADKETITKQLEKTNTLISQGKFADAEKELGIAKNLNAKYPPVVEMEKRLAAAKAGPKKEAEAKLAQAKGLAGQGRLDEAIRLAAEAAKLDPQNSEAPRLAREWQALKEKAAKLKEEGRNLETQGKLDGAVAKYQEAIKLLADPQLAQHVADLQARLGKEKQNRELAEKLRKEGEVLEGQKKLAEAVAKYQESLKHLADAKLGEHVKALQARLEEDKRNKETAKRLRNEGAALQQQGNLTGAIGKYQESLKYFPDSNLKDHISKLRVSQERVSRTESPQPGQEGQKPASTGASPSPSARKVPPASNNFTGSFGGTYTAGKVNFTVNGNRMSGTMKGTITWGKSQFPFTGSIQGTVSANGEINGSLTGMTGKVAINGSFRGTIRGKAASGTWQAKALMADSGNWRANPSGQ